MRARKTISNWLTTRYQLIIRSEENFAEKTSLGFTYSKIILFSLILFTGLFGLSLFMAKTILAKWFDPKHEQMVLNQQLLDLSLKVDSLALESDRKDQFIANIQKVLNGDTSALNQIEGRINEPSREVIKPANLKNTSLDSAFRKEYENSDLSLVNFAKVSYGSLSETFFYSPLTGFISDRYNLKSGHLGVDIVAKANEPVKCVADGTVVFASWTQDAGYVMMVQHMGNLITIYKHNAQLLKKVGTFVSGGEIISIVGNSGELTNGPHLHFELWLNGNSLNPEEFINF